MITLDEARRIETQELRSRVTRLKWKVVEREAGLFKVPNGPVVQLPNEVSEATFPAFQFFIKELMEFERLLSVSELFSRTKAAQDIIYAGPDFDRPAGRIGMKDAEPFYRNMTRFVRAIVMAERKEAQLTRTRHAIEDRIEYGDVIASSYLVAVHIPLDPIPAPLGRRVSTRLVRCLHDLEAAREPTLQPEVWSPEICDAVWKLFDESNATEFKAQSSPDPIVPGADRALLEPVEIPLQSGGVQAALLEGAASMRGLKPVQDAVVTGIPFRVENKEWIEEGGKRTVMIHWKRPGGAVHVEVELNAHEFDKLVPTMNKKQTVSIEGLLEQKGNRWTLTPLGQSLRFD